MCASETSVRMLDNRKIASHEKIKGRKMLRKSVTRCSLLNNFVLSNILVRFDKDKSGDVTLVELKNGLKEIGIKMTNR